MGDGVGCGSARASDGGASSVEWATSSPVFVLAMFAGGLPLIGLPNHTHTHTTHTPNHNHVPCPCHRCLLRRRLGVRPCARHAHQLRPPHELRVRDRRPGSPPCPPLSHRALAMLCAKPEHDIPCAACQAASALSRPGPLCSEDALLDLSLKLPRLRRRACPPSPACQ